MKKYKLIIRFLRMEDGSVVAYDGAEIFRNAGEIEEMCQYPKRFGYEKFYAFRRARRTPRGEEITYRCEAWTN